MASQVTYESNINQNRGNKIFLSNWWNIQIAIYKRKSSGLFKVTKIFLKRWIARSTIN